MTTFLPRRLTQFRGFTLLEVMVALSILAISTMSVISQTGQSLRHLEQLQLKTVAMVIAENRLNVIQINENWPSNGRQTQSLTFADQQWLVNTDVSSTSEPWLRKIEINVMIETAKQPVSLLYLTSYRGRY